MDILSKQSNDSSLTICLYINGICLKKLLLKMYWNRFTIPDVNLLIFNFREMCYLCSQRAERNVPVYTRHAEEVIDREAAKTLVMAEQRKAEVAIQAESELRSQKRVSAKEVAAFNLGAAQATKEKKADDEKHKLPHV